MDQDTNVNKTKKTKKLTGSAIMVRIMVLVVVLSLGAAVYFYAQYKDASSSTPDAVAAKNAEESTQVIAELNDVLLLTDDTDPTVARVDDAEALKAANPDFYSNVKNGDYLILYPSRAVIFRSEDKQIINVAPIINTTNLDTSTKDTSTSE